MICFIAGFIISLVLPGTLLALFGKHAKRLEKDKRNGAIPVTVRGMIAVFIALFFIYLPVYLWNYEPLSDKNTTFIVRPVMLCIHNALRTFILDGEADMVIKNLYETEEQGCGYDLFRVLYSVYTIFLYIVAPLLTFGTVLSYFSSFFGNLKLFFTVKRPVCVMSELNERSVILADSILERYRNEKAGGDAKAKKSKDPLIVYMDIRKRDETDEQLLLAAQRQHAVQLRQNVENFSMNGWYSGRVEIFLIGDEKQEAQNVRQAVSIVSRMEKKAAEDLADKPEKEKKSKLFSKKTDKEYTITDLNRFLSEIDGKIRKKMTEVAGKTSNGGDTADVYLEDINSVTNDINEYKPLRSFLTARKWWYPGYFITPRFRYNVGVFVFATKKSSAAILDSVNYETLLKVSTVIGLDSEEAFRLRRVDDVRQLAWKTVSGQEHGMRQYLFTEKTKREGISVLMVGLGRHGFEFLKFLLWYCQVEGFRLQLNLIDKNDISEQLAAECPELMEKNGCGADGDGIYDIRCLDKTDIGGRAYYEYFEYDGPDPEKQKLRNRLQKTNVALVALGDDDLNIQTSLDLRAVFDRVNQFKATGKTREADEMLQIFTIVYDMERTAILEQEGGLINYKSIPYNIHFCGSVSEQYSYDSIFEPDMETDAFAEHIDWAGNNLKIWMELDNKTPPTEALWKMFEEGEYKPEELKRRYDLSIDYFDYTQERMKYERFEYYRLSSIARVYHAQLRSDLTEMGLLPDFGTDVGENGKPQHQENKRFCGCRVCKANKKSEHMRWNVYMRTGGYRFGPRRDRALTHNNLVTFDSLDDIEQAKDCNCRIPRRDKPSPAPGKSDADEAS